MTPQEKLMNELGRVIGDSAEYGMSFDDTAPTVMELAVKLTRKVLGDEGAVIMLRRIADGIAGPTKLNIVNLYSTKD